jgi:hypothetical protein
MQEWPSLASGVVDTKYQFVAWALPAAGQTTHASTAMIITASIPLEADLMRVLSAAVAGRITPGLKKDTLEPRRVQLPDRAVHLADR